MSDDWILPSGRWSSRKVPPEVRFWRHVNKDGPTPQHCPHLGPCWEWTGAHNKRGYGKFGVIWSRPDYAHRYSWELATGTPPGELLVCHHCDNPPCVNPAHLFLGTASDNGLDMIAKGRGAKVDQRGEKNGNATLTGAEVEAMRAEYRSGDVTQLDLAEKYGVSRTEAGRILRGLNWGTKGATSGPLYRKGESAGMAKLTEDQVRAIRERTEPNTWVAREFSVSPTLIGLIKRRLIWTHVA